MRVVDLQAIAAASLALEPYRYFIGSNALKDGASGVLADLPAIGETGFFPVGELPLVGGFRDLVTDLNDPAFSAVVGEKLGVDLTSRPRLITLRHWSAATDGRIHTDSAGKIATVLIYLNERWQDSHAGRLRVLRSGGNFDDYVAEISPVLGTVFGFRRGENSWHGHLPYAGERKVVQVAWLTDEAKVARKTRTAKLSRWLKKLNPLASLGTGRRLA